MLEDMHNRGQGLTGSDAGAIRAKLKDIYGEQYHAEIDSREDDEIMEMASILVAGVPMGTPVFDGAREADVSAMLVKAGADPSGQGTLSHGRPGAGAAPGG